VNTLLSLSAILFYLGTALSRLYQLRTMISQQQLLYKLGGVAVASHAVILSQSMFTPTGLNLGISNAASLVAWVIALLLLITLIKKPVENLLLVVFPTASLAIAIDLLMHSERILNTEKGLGVQIHVFFSIVAYSLLSITALQAIFLAIQEYQLRHKNLSWAMRHLPPLQVMESLLFQMMGLGLMFLSISLASGFIFLEDIFAQHLVHKTILSIAAWCVFSALLYGHWQYGWRGKTAVRWSLFGFFVLMLAYFGSKVVLELVLKRV
jgi:ABC-type uncharacterized transport system permease subunit